MTAFAREYGEGLYALAKEEGLTDRLLEELKELYTCVKAEPAFLQLLSNASVPKAERLQVLDASLRGQVHSYILNFLKILCEKAALHELKGCMDVYTELYNKDNGIVKACVISGKPLSPERKQAIALSLQKKTGKEVLLETKLDSSLLDGFILEMDGKQYDFSLRQRLDGLREAIVQQGMMSPKEGDRPCS